MPLISFVFTTIIVGHVSFHNQFLKTWFFYFPSFAFYHKIKVQDVILYLNRMFWG
ncbi:hypothetical protein B4168_2936 [Anoxybacillus flavithermus]|nr:hypothetical protein B4168_2936 [Anoxybacillus flavithermus]OAO86225.1 hypothetical protein GT23_2118 [Parageobacillus thermoglucosidasius]